MFTPEQIAQFKTEIIDHISGGETLRDYCRIDGKPSKSAIYVWKEADTEFAGHFTRARELGADEIAESIMEIVDDASNDWMERLGKDGQPIGWMLNGDHVQRSKLRAETRLKLLAKWFPQKYGDKLDLNHGGQPNNPISAIQVEIIRAKE